MKDQELFNKTVSILVKAYQNDALRHGDCSACAVGNLIFNSNSPWPEDDQLLNWYDVVMFGKHTEEGNKQTSYTGYSKDDLYKIERAFEKTRLTPSYDSDGYLGLMAVVNTLMQIHEATTEEAKAAKELFVKQPC